LVLFDLNNAAAWWIFLVSLFVGPAGIGAIPLVTSTTLPPAAR
jgi:hypothetical protein